MRVSKNVKGKIIFLNNEKGFGFFLPNREFLIFKKIFFHVSQIRKISWDELKIGDSITARIVYKNTKGYEAVKIYKNQN